MCTLCFLEDFEQWASLSGSPIFDKMSSYKDTLLDKHQHSNALGPGPPQTWASLSSVALGVWHSGSGLKWLCLQAGICQRLRVTPQ